MPIGKVFISHTSADKDRFVLDFDRKLRAKGIDTWLDKWEILPGDSLVQRIFEEGLQNAQAVIVVLSKNSVDKNWVQAELNVGVIKHINEESELIPVVIDDCVIPTSLRDTLHLKINDITNYDAEVDNIVAAIYGHHQRPPLGSPPSYVQHPVDFIPNLTFIDNQVFKLVCEEALARSNTRGLLVEHLEPKALLLDIPAKSFRDSLEVLSGDGFLKSYRVIGPVNPYSVSVTVSGFEQFLRQHLSDYESIKRQVASRIINYEDRNSNKLAETVSQSLIIVNHIVDKFEQDNFVSVSITVDGTRHIQTVSVKFKRWLEQG